MALVHNLRNAAGFTLTVIWLGVFAWYCSTAMTPVPYQDDWAFVVTLQQYLDGHLNTATYAMTLHNGHPTLPARLLFLGLYTVSDLSLETARMVTAVAFPLAAAALFPVVGVALGPSRAPLGTRLIYFLPCLLVVVSLEHWEILSMASTVSNAFVLLLSLAAVTAAGRGFRTDDSRWLILGAFAALGATFSLAHGALTWLALACQAIIARRPRPAVACALALAGVAAIALLVAPGSSAAPRAVDITQFVHAALVAAGTAIVGFVDNQAVPSANFAAGAVITALAIGSGVVLRRADADVRDRVNESAGLMVLGALGIAALAYGRLDFGPEYMASSRYAAVVLPLTAGLYLFWVSRPALGAPIVLALVTAIIVSAEAVTNHEEWQMAPHRAHFMEDTAWRLRCSPPDDAVLLQRTIDDMQDDYRAGRAFLVSRRLSVFSEPFSCEAPEH